MNDNNLLASGSIGRLLIKFSVPSIISLVLNAVYNMVDQIFIGQGVGYLGNGATNVIFPMMQLAIAFALLFGDGTANYMNIKMGLGDVKCAGYGMASGLVGAIGAGLIITLLYNILLEPLCWFFGATDLTIWYSLEYGRIVSLGMVFSVFSGATMSIIRADGSPFYAMMGMVAGCVINLIGDPLAIFVLDMGVAGAAWATVAGMAVNSVINIYYLACKTRSVHLEKKYFLNCCSYISQIIKSGLSSFFTQVAIVIVVAVQNNVLVYYGAKSSYGAEIPMTSLGVTMKVFTLIQCAVTGLVTGAQPIFSFNYGCGLYDRVKKTFYYVLAVTIVITGLATVVFQFAPMAVVSIFGSSDPLYNRFSVLCLRIFLMFLVLDGVQMAASYFLQSVARPVKASVLVLLRQIVIQIPLVLFLPKFFGVEGVLYSGPSSAFFVGILSILFLLSERKTLAGQKKCKA